MCECVPSHTVFRNNKFLGVGLSSTNHPDAATDADVDEWSSAAHFGAFSFCVYTVNHKFTHCARERISVRCWRPVPPGPKTPGHADQMYSVRPHIRLMCARYVRFGALHRTRSVPQSAAIRGTGVWGHAGLPVVCVCLCRVDK